MSELVTDYLEQALPLPFRLRARVHLLLCPACRRYFAQMRQTARLLGGQSLPPPSDVVEADLLARLNRGEGPTPPE